MEILKLLSTSEIVAQILCFMLVLFLLKKFAWKGILKSLDDRRDRIAAEFKKIEGLHAEVDNMKNDYREKMNEIEKVMREKINEAVLEGKRVASEMREKAQIDGKNIMANAEAEIKQEIAKARGELKRELVDIVIGATEKVIEEKVTDEKEKEMITSFLFKAEKTK
ncbi:MAG: F0F1 ATP synthase subunit B [Candidatus Omnitrophica bacterium]|nr:F0F1 ATP synthase subunit B [Candidatus Omnitrophota bacterium]